MKKGKRLGIVLLTASSLLLSACGTSIPEMTEEESAQIVEYAAGLLLKYDANYHSRLVETEPEDVEVQDTINEPDQTEVIDTVEQSMPEDVSSEDSNNNETVVVEKGKSIEEFYEINDVEIKYAGFEIKDVYPDYDTDEMYPAINASKGCKLLVINFNVQNIGQQDVNVDMVSAGAKFKYSINNGPTRYAMTTMLENDLGSYIGTVTSGEVKNLILLGEIREEEADSVQAVSLTMKNLTGDAKALLN